MPRSGLGGSALSCGAGYPANCSLSPENCFCGRLSDTLYPSGDSYRTSSMSWSDGGKAGRCGDSGRLQFFATA